MKKLLLFSAAVCIAAAANAQAVTTYSGTGVAGFGLHNTSSIANAKYDNPYGVAYDSKGRLWVTDNYSNMVVMLNPTTGKYERRSGEPNGGGGYNNTNEPGGPMFQGPSGIAFGENDTVFISDEQNHAIRKLTPFQLTGSNQTLKTLAGGGATGGLGTYGEEGFVDNVFGTAARFSFPEGLAVSKDKTYLLVCDAGNGVIRKIVIKGSDYGKVTTFAGKGGESGSTDGGVLTTARFMEPEGILIVGDDIYIAEYGGGVRKISNGQVTTIVKNASAGGSVDMPTSIVLNGNSLYVADGCNIKRIDLTTKNVVRFAGGEMGDCDFADDNGQAAKFAEVGQMVLSPDSTFIMIADQLNNRIRKMTIPKEQQSTGIFETSATSYSIFPNPAQDNVKVSGITGNSAITLCDMTGRVVMQYNTSAPVYRMDVSSVANGVYVLRISNGGQVSSERIVINR